MRMSFATAEPFVTIDVPVALSVTRPIGWVVMIGGVPAPALTAKMAASFPPLVLGQTRLMVLIAALLATGIIWSYKRAPGVLGLREPLELRGSREKGCGPMPMRFGRINGLLNWSEVLLNALTLGAIRPKQT